MLCTGLLARNFFSLYFRQNSLKVPNTPFLSRRENEKQKFHATASLNDKEIPGWNDALFLWLNRQIRIRHACSKGQAVVWANDFSLTFWSLNEHWLNEGNEGPFEKTESRAIMWCFPTISSYLPELGLSTSQGVTCWTSISTVRDWKSENLPLRW